MLLLCIFCKLRPQLYEINYEARKHMGSRMFTLKSSRPALGFPQVCVVIRIYSRANPRYHCPFLYDDARDTIGRRSGLP